MLYTYENISFLQRVLTLMALSFLLLTFSAKTVKRNFEWHSTQRIAQSALAVNPGNAKLHMSMGNVLAQQVRIMLYKSSCKNAWHVICGSPINYLHLIRQQLRRNIACTSCIWVFFDLKCAKVALFYWWPVHILRIVGGSWLLSPL